LISSQDRQLKTEDIYVKEQGAFSGFTAEVARKLSDWIEVRPVEQQPDGDRIHVRLDLTLPDANAVAPLVLDWDEERLNKLSRQEQKRILETLQKLRRNGELKMIRGDEELALVRDGAGWKVFLDWAAGVRIAFAATTDGAAVEAEPAPRETIVRPGELFNIDYRVKNLGAQNLVARIVHHVEPKTLAEHLDLVECALLFPVELRPHQEQIYTSRYLVRSDLPEGTREIKVTYEFKVER
jgi:hypothetical protein